jgi:hypothetical protein
MMSFLEAYNLTGVAIGACTFLIIGAFHPLVVKGEYYFGVKCWRVFLLMGVAGLAAAVWVRETLPSALLSVAAFGSFWAILEVFEQRKRVARGWFPKRAARRPKKPLRPCPQR